MLKVLIRAMKIVVCLIVFCITLTRPDAVKGASLIAASESGESAPVLFNHLLQNIDQEAEHYSIYVDYREDLRLKAFWDQLEKINLSRDEIIQDIARLEKKAEASARTSTTPISSKPFDLFVSGDLARIFSNWRPFYVLMSGGFFLFIIGLFLLSCGITCQRRVFFMLSRALKGLPVYDLLGLDESDPHRILHKRAA